LFAPPLFVTDSHSAAAFVPLHMAEGFKASDDLLLGVRSPGCAMSSKPRK
jgi:hypothetical protein